MNFINFYKNLFYRNVDNLDIPYLLELRKNTMTPHLKSAGMAIDENTLLERVKFHFDSGKIVYHENEKIGFLKFEYEKEWIHLIQIQIDSKYQNRGFGKELLNYLVEESKSRKLKIRLEVLKCSPAKRLYDSYDFKIIGEDLYSYEMERGE